MASISKRGERYRALIRRGNQPSISKTFTRKSDAVAWARSIEVQIERGEYKRDAGITLSDAIDRYLTEKPRLKKGKLLLGEEIATCEKTYLEWWRNRLGHKKLSDLRKSDFSDARSDLLKTVSRRTGKSLSPASVNRRVARISSVLSICVKIWDWSDTNPVLELPQFQEVQRKRYLSDYELLFVKHLAETLGEPIAIANDEAVAVVKPREEVAH